MSVAEAALRPLYMFIYPSFLGLLAVSLAVSTVILKLLIARVSPSIDPSYLTFRRAFVTMAVIHAFRLLVVGLVLFIGAWYHGDLLSASSTVIIVGFSVAYIAYRYRVNVLRAAVPVGATYLIMTFLGDTVIPHLWR